MLSSMCDIGMAHGTWHMAGEIFDKNEKMRALHAHVQPIIFDKNGYHSLTRSLDQRESVRPLSASQKRRARAEPR
jgi:hypothetical protein